MSNDDDLGPCLHFIYKSSESNFGGSIFSPTHKRPPLAKMMQHCPSTSHAASLPKPSVKSHYILPSDDSEIKRLNLQNRYLTRELCNGKLIFAPVRCRPGDKVLESGTGTGVWLLDLAKETHPTVYFTGIDIQPRFLPSSPPKNMTFSVNSITDLPAEWSERFNFVNQRLLVGGLTGEGWNTALGEIHRVLAPGGWFQCIEPLMPKRTETEVIGPYTVRMFGVLQDLLGRNGMLYDVVDMLGRALPKTGFVRVQKHTMLLSVHRGQEEFDQRVLMEWFFRALKPGMLAMKLLGSDTEFDGLMESMLKEWDAAPRAAFGWAIIYAQKMQRV